MSPVAVATLLLLFAATATAESESGAVPNSRFKLTGEAVIRQASSDGRFILHAGARYRPDDANKARFSLPDAIRGAACTSLADSIFANGFD